MQDATSTYSNANNSDIIAAISATLQTNVMCHGDVVTNVAELRRSIARVSCTSENGTVRIDELPDSADSPPIPQGFVIPRLWDTTWTPTWAKSNGWIQDPYYDWLMPTQQVPTNGTMPSVTPPPAANPKPAPAPAPTPAPAPAADDSEADDSEAIDWKPYVKWAIGLAVCLVVIIGIYMVWKSIESRRSQREQVGETAVDEAFDNSAPPTDVSLADQDFDAGQGGNNSTEGYNAGQGNNNTVPNTSDLMNDLPSPSRKSRQ